MHALSLLIKPASGNCNMRCRYCFYADIADHRAIANYGMMSPETAEILVRKSLAEAEKLCIFAFQGGEPTLAGLDFFRTFVDLVKKHNSRNAEIRYAIQTNGLLIDDEWAAFLGMHNFLTGLSIDANREVHDDLRLDAAGKGTFKRTLDAAHTLRKHKVEFNILSVLTRRMASHPDTTYKFYKNKGFGHIQFIPCLEELDRSGAPEPHRLDAHQYGKFLCRIFDLWYRDFCAGEYVSIRIFDNYIHMLAGRPPENCAMTGQCRANILVEADGGVFPCDFYALDEHRLGSIHDDSSLSDLLSGDQAVAFVQPSLAVHPQCRECAYAPLCRGGCRRDREPVENGIPGLNRYCDAYRMFFNHALPRMRDVTRRLFR